MAQYIYGKNTIMSRIAKEADIEEIYLVKGFKDKHILDNLSNYKVSFVSMDKINRLAKGNHQGIVAKIHTYEYTPLDKLKSKIKNKDDALILVLDGIEDPHNLGAIIRSCDAIGVDGVIVKKHGACPLTSTVAKVSTGALEFVDVCEVTNLTTFINDMKKEGFWAFGAEATNSVDYRSLDYRGKTILVVGSEGKGISRLVLEQCDYKIALPMVGHVNSLNVSVATAILLYEIYSNRHPLK
ncbi:MAG: 23S rRNA (guanosine(2251)-2'-O)-methyltransferase RlmB [Bacilli bacterium]|nr:23S rRNA (guanosine(2251)-2'-O)-methyltransferase RlmB [Bacilli bacterium]